MTNPLVHWWHRLQLFVTRRDRYCLACGQPLIGRSWSRFCSERCDLDYDSDMAW